MESVTLGAVLPPPPTDSCTVYWAVCPCVTVCDVGETVRLHDLQLVLASTWLVAPGAGEEPRPAAGSMALGVVTVLTLTVRALVWQNLEPVALGALLAPPHI